MATDNATEKVCPLDMRRDGFHLLNTIGRPVFWSGIADTVVIAEGDCLVENGSGTGAALAAAEMTGVTFLGIAAAAAGVVTADANDSTLVPIFLVTDDDLMWTKVSTGTTAYTMAGNDYDLDGEDGISQSDEAIAALGMAFHVVATDTTNSMVLGRFLRGLVV